MNLVMISSGNGLSIFGDKQLAELLLYTGSCQLNTWEQA